MNDIYIYKVPNLPGHIRGLVTEIEGDYIIILRDDMDRPAALSTLQHELEHIKEYDLRSECYAGYIEKCERLHKEGNMQEGRLSRTL